LKPGAGVAAVTVLPDRPARACVKEITHAEAA
jgi:hypothetical protein